MDLEAVSDYMKLKKFLLAPVSKIFAKTGLKMKGKKVLGV